MKILLKLEYDGAGFGGWQRQKNAESVQGVLEKAISELVGENIALVASGRTDAGVHALGQCAHFSMKKEFDAKRLPLAINARLPQTIRVLDAAIVPEEFSARYDVKKKTYLYKLYARKISSPTRDGRYAHVPYELDFDSMVRAAKLFVGKHNFKGFCSQGSSAQTFEREIYSLDVSHDGDEFFFKITGNGFLYNMVRRIVGALVEVGKGMLDEKGIKLALEDFSHPHITKNMPACGLYLYDVVYA